MYFEVTPCGNSSKVDNVTIHNVTNGERHTLKKGKLFSAIQDVHIELK